LMLMIIGQPPDDAQEQSVRIVERIKPILSGAHPAVVGVALAELVAIFIAGHQVDREAHEGLLALHAETVRDLVPIIEASINADMKGATQ